MISYLTSWTSESPNCSSPWYSCGDDEQYSENGDLWKVLILLDDLRVK